MSEIKDIRLFYLALRFVPGIGYAKSFSLISHFGNIRNVFNQDVSAIKEVCKIKSEDFDKQFNRRILFEKAEKELEQIIKKGYGIITYEDENYPIYLKNIPNPPTILYYKGNILYDDLNTIAIVGTRTPTEEGSELAYRLSFDLSERGFTVVSGLAKGIDTYSHKGCIDNEKRTIAVLGSGIDVIYPYENKNLVEQIVSNNGLILTEFPLGTKPERFNFPQRNRIIAGLSLGVVVVQSPEDSGALITAKLGNDFGRTIFAFPGKPGSKMYKGSNQLLKEGAYLIENANDVVEQLKYEISTEKDIKNYTNNKEKKLKITKDFTITKEKSNHIYEEKIENSKKEKPEKSYDENLFNEDERKILDCLKNTEKKHIDQLCIESGLGIVKTGKSLTSLLLKDIIKEHSGKYYTLKIDDD